MEPISTSRSAPDHVASAFPAPSVNGSNEGQPRLRQSCDACAGAKVKCNKDHPRCERCVASGATCVYGPSRKYGKLSQRRRQAENNKSISSNNSVNDLPTVASQQTKKQQLLQQQLQQQQQQQQQQAHHSPQHLSHSPQRLRTQSAMLPMTDNKTYMPNHWQPQPMDDVMRDFDGNMFVPGWVSMLDPFDTLSDSPGGGRPGMHKGSFSTLDDAAMNMTDTTPSRNSSAFSRTTTNPSTHTFTTFESASPSSSTSTGLHDLSSMGTSYNSMHFPDFATTDPDYFAASHARNSPKEQHSCSELAYATLTSIQHSTNPTGDAAPTPFHYMSNGPTLDSILQNNRIAIANVLQLLKCPCAKDPHNAVLYSSIISKILCQYQVAAGMSTPPSGYSETERTSSEELASLKASRSNSICGSSPAPNGLLHDNVMIGTFKPDKEDQEPLRRVLLLSELRKARQLVDLLPVAEREMGMEIDGGAEKLYATLGAWLKSELLRTTKAVRDGVVRAVATP